MEEVFHASSPKAEVLPYMQRGATDGSWLRERGMPVYGVPVFQRQGQENRAHANDERISLDNMDRGTNLLLQIVLAVTQ